MPPTAHDTGEAASLEVATSGPTDTPTILIVDDNPENLQVLFSTLQAAHYRVLAAQDARGALARVERRVPDLILLDIMMPGVDGFELYRLLRQREPLQEVPVIFLSALSDSESVVRGLNMNAVDYISKPFRPEEVVARVARHLELARLRHALEDQNRQLGEEIARRQRSEEAYRVLVEHSLQGLAIVQEGRFVFANPALGEISGYRPEEILGGTTAAADRRLFPDRPGLFSNWLARIGDGEEALPETVRLRHRDGGTRWWQVFGTPVNYRGRPAVQIALVDVSERVELEQIAQQAQERAQRQAARLSILNEIAQSMSDITDLDSALASASAALAHLFRDADILILIREVRNAALLVAGHLARHADGKSLAGRCFPVTGDALLEALQQSHGAVVLDGDPPGTSLLAEALGLGQRDARVIAAPLIAHGEFVGLLLVRRTRAVVDSGNEEPGLAETVAGQMAGVIGSAQLYRQIQARHQELLAQQRFTQSLLEASPGPVFVKDPQERFLMVNRAFAEIYGVEPTTMVGRLEDSYNTDSRQLERFRRNNRETMASGKTVQIQEEFIPGPDGQPRWYKTVVSPFFDAAGKAQGIIGSLTDITAQKQAEEKLARMLAETEKLANQDGLTRLANRRHFDQRLDQEWRRARREQQPLALLMVDVDHFKRYNDRYGHLAGDDCLRVIARLLGQVIRRPADLAARYGGEEFVVLMPNTDAGGARRVAEGLCQRLDELSMVHLDAPTGRLTLSLGIAVQLPDGGKPAQLIAAADNALYRAKAGGRNRIVG